MGLIILAEAIWIGTFSPISASKMGGVIYGTAVGAIAGGALRGAALRAAAVRGATTIAAVAGTEGATSLIVSDAILVGVGGGSAMEIPELAPQAYANAYDEIAIILN